MIETYVYCCDKFYKNIFGGIYLETLPGLGKYENLAQFYTLALKPYILKQGGLIVQFLCPIIRYILELRLLSNL